MVGDRRAVQAPPDVAAERVGVRAGQGGVTPGDHLAPDHRQGGRAVGVRLGGGVEFRQACAEVELERVRGVRIAAHREVGCGDAVAGAALHLTDLLVAEIVERGPDLAAAPVRPRAGHRGPGLVAHRGRADPARAGADRGHRLGHIARRRVDQHRRRDRPGIGGEVGDIATGVLARVEGGVGRADEHLLGGAGDGAVAPLLHLGQAHQHPVEPAAGQRHQVHGIEQAVALVQLEAVGAAHVAGALHQQLGHMARLRRRRRCSAARRGPDGRGRRHRCWPGHAPGRCRWRRPASGRGTPPPPRCRRPRRASRRAGRDRRSAGPGSRRRSGRRAGLGRATTRRRWR